MAVDDESLLFGTLNQNNEFKDGILTHMLKKAARVSYAIQLLRFYTGLHFCFLKESKHDVVMLGRSDFAMLERQFQLDVRLEFGAAVEKRRLHQKHVQTCVRNVRFEQRVTFFDLSSGKLNSIEIRREILLEQTLGII
jgi:hypothetical protein